MKWIFSLTFFVIHASTAWAAQVEYLCTAKEDDHRYVVKLRNDRMEKKFRGDACYNLGDNPFLCADGSWRQGSGCGGQSERSAVLSALERYQLAVRYCESHQDEEQCESDGDGWDPAPANY